METRTTELVRRNWQGQLISYAPYLLGAIFLILVPPFLPLYFRSIMTKTLIFAIFAMSLDLIYGYTALFSLGHAAFFGAGAYTVGLFALHAGIDSVWITAPGGILVATALAALFGLISVRFADIYFLLITFALGQLMYSLTYLVRWLKSPGLEGIVSIPKPDFGIAAINWNSTKVYFLVFITFLICFFILNRIVHSPFGQSLKGIRESEERMRVLGYNTWLYKYLAYVIAGLFAGVAGVLFAWERSFISPECVGADYSFFVMVMVIIGGAGTMWGSIIGAFLMIFLEQMVSLYVPERWPMILGVLFVLTALFFRGGLAPHIVRYWKRLRYHNGSS